MGIDKTLQKIKIQIGELSETMQSFVHETIQPSTGDCDKIRHQMNDLLELLSVYKHLKTNNEIEPGFNLHAKVSEKAVAIEEIKETVKSTHIQAEPVASPQPPAQPASALQRSQPLKIGINDKFRLINELFSQNNSEYSIVMEQLQNLKTWHESEIYLNSLKNVYNWRENSEVVKYFYGLVKKSFD